MKTVAIAEDLSVRIIRTIRLFEFFFPEFNHKISIIITIEDQDYLNSDRINDHQPDPKNTFCFYSKFEKCALYFHFVLVNTC